MMNALAQRGTQLIKNVHNSQVENYTDVITCSTMSRISVQVGIYLIIFIATILLAVVYSNKQFLNAGALTVGL